MASTFADSHGLGYIAKDGIKCTICKHTKAIAYTKGKLFCWHCKNQRALTQDECDTINAEIKQKREQQHAL